MHARAHTIVSVAGDYIIFFNKKFQSFSSPLLYRSPSNRLFHFFLFLSFFVLFFILLLLFMLSCSMWCLECLTRRSTTPRPPCMAVCAHSCTRARTLAHTPLNSDTHIRMYKAHTRTYAHSYMHIHGRTHVPTLRACTHTLIARSLMRAFQARTLLCQRAKNLCCAIRRHRIPPP